MKKIFPSRSDINILLSYMAGCIQYKGEKFSYAPVLHGIYGGGNALICQCLQYAIGDEYTYLPLSNRLGSALGKDIQNKLLVYVQEFRKTHATQQKIQNIKLLINGHSSNYNIANFILTTENDEAIEEAKESSTFATFSTAQKTEEDLIDADMDYHYFNKLESWLKDGGYAIVNEYLSTYAIPDEYNPTKLHFAPQTSHFYSAVNDTNCVVSMKIIEAISHGKLGFKRGWISSTWVSRLIDVDFPSKIHPVRKIKRILESLGYIKHPALTDGRVNAILTTDSCKSRLYVKKYSEQSKLVSPKQVAEAYEQAQK